MTVTTRCAHLQWLREDTESKHVKYEFDAVIKLLEGKMKWSVIYFPHPAQDHLGTNGRVNVKAALDGHEFDGVLLPSRNGHYLAFNVPMKNATGKKLGDSVHVVLEKCDEKREVVVPDYISMALKESAALDKFLEMPYYIRREEIARIESAKGEDTRSRRLQALVGKLTGRAA